MDPQSSQSTIPPAIPATPVPLSTPSTPANTPPKSSPLTSIAIVLLGVAALAVAAYFVGAFVTNKKVATPTSVATMVLSPTPTPDPTANWSMYTNESQNYSFKYPPTWKAETNLSLKSGALFGPDATGSSGLGGVEIRESVGTPSQYMDNLEKDGVLTYKNRREISISGLAGVRAEHEGYPVSGHSVIVQKGPMIYNIYINNKDKGNVDIFDQILSTFKFLDKN